MMSLVYMGVGQCGTQLLSSLVKESMEKSRSNCCYLLDEISQFRGLLVDAEPKAIQRIRKKSNLKAHLRITNLLVGQTGSGSNWAYGYFQHTGPNSLVDESLNAIRRETEKLDRCYGMCLVHSLAGGTGSGLGIRLADEVKDELNIKLRVTFSVVPHHYGDAPLQAYNTLLTLGRLTQCSDTVTLLHNDWLLAQLEYSGARKNANRIANEPVPRTSRIEVDEMNQLAAEQMNSLLSPCTSEPYTYIPNNESSIHWEPMALSYSLTSLSGVNLIRLISAHHENKPSTDTWDNLIEKIPNTLKQCPIDATWNLNKPMRKTGCRPFGTIAGLLIYRGVENRFWTDTVEKTKLLGKLTDYMRPVSWNQDVWEQWADNTIWTGKKSLTLAFNSCCIAEDLNCLLYRVQSRRQVGAYLHWFERFGCTADMFDAASEQIQHVVKQYEELE